MTFDAYLTAEGETATAFAKRAGLTIVSVCRYRTGDRTPDPRAMQIIATATGGKVTANDFYGLRLPRGERSRRRHDASTKAS